MNYIDVSLDGPTDGFRHPRGRMHLGWRKLSSTESPRLACSLTYRTLTNIVLT